jgi:hypothetical protein
MVIDKLKNRAESMNRVSEYVNTIVPVIQERLVQGFKLKVDGTLYQKDKDDLQAILDSYDSMLASPTYGGSMGRVWLRSDLYSIILKASDSYTNDYYNYQGSSGCYTSTDYNDTVNIWDNKENIARPLVKRVVSRTAEELRTAEKELREIDDRISGLRYRNNQLKNLLGR